MRGMSSMYKTQKTPQHDYRGMRGKNKTSLRPRVKGRVRVYIMWGFVVIRSSLKEMRQFEQRKK